MRFKGSERSSERLQKEKGEEMKFKINNRTWKIKEMSQEEVRKEMVRHNDSPIDGGKYFGITYIDEQVILIDKSLNIETKRHTLKHELMHCYIETYITHEEKTFNTEDVCDISANAHDIIHEMVEKYFK